MTAEEAPYAYAAIHKALDQTPLFRNRQLGKALFNLRQNRLIHLVTPFNHFVSLSEHDGIQATAASFASS